jgi:hypothetical protein
MEVRSILASLKAWPWADGKRKLDGFHDQNIFAVLLGAARPDFYSERCCYYHEDALSGPRSPWYKSVIYRGAGLYAIYTTEGWITYTYRLHTNASSR